MNNDLISREALKEKFIERLDEGFFVYSEIMSIINNAPTVAESCKELQKVATERPQGEWEEGNHGDYERPDFYFQCSVCKEETDDETPYCPYCGAKMKGGAE